MIIFLSLSLAGLLVIKDYYFSRRVEPRLIDRLPEGDFLIRVNVLDVARETSGMLYFNKVQFRDFFSYEFLLGQAKSFGLNLQRPAYIFANEQGDWGAMMYVTDSSKVQTGVQRLKKLLDIQDSVVFDQTVYFSDKENAFLAYSKNWLFVYKGDEFKKNFMYVKNAKLDHVAPAWDAFLKEKKFRSQKLVLSSNWRSMKRYGLEKAIFAHDSDSSSFTLMAYVRSVRPWSVTPKEGGKGLAIKNNTNRFLNIHVDSRKLLRETDDPIYRLMDRMARKVSFPLQDFLRAWNGDLSFRQGGNLTVQEKFIETTFDDNFNPVEVESTREVQVPGFSLAISFNDYYQRLLERLLQKGILTQEGEKYRFLLSPLLNYSRNGTYHMFYSGDAAPQLVPDNANNGIWNERGTKFQFQLDSVTTNEAYGTLNFPVQRLIRRNKFF